MRIGTTFVIIGLGLLAAASVIYLRTSHAAWWALAWPASSFLAVGGAYLANLPALLGKRPDGTLRIAHVIALLPFFAVTWMAWRLLRLRGNAVFHQAAPRLYIGRRPIGNELPNDVRWVVDLTSEFPLGVTLDAHTRYETLPTLDGHVPGEHAFVELARRIADSDVPVYVHCAQGHGRAALMTAAVLLSRKLATSAHDAERKLKTLRPGVHLTPSQRALLQRVESRLA